MRRSSTLPSLVAASADSIALRTSLGIRSRRPITVSRTPLAMQRSTSDSRYLRNSRISISTSRCGRFQLSAEKAYSVSTRMPHCGAVSTILRAVRAPSMWPVGRLLPRLTAQRPLPSMMIATCRPGALSSLCSVACATLPLGRAERVRSIRLLVLTRRMNECFHVIEVSLDCAASLGRQPILGPRHAPLERLGAAHVVRVLELARVDAQIPVGDLEQLLQVVEAELLVHRQRAH